MNKTAELISTKDGFQSFRSTTIGKLSNASKVIVDRLANKTGEKKQSRLRDRHGNRANVL